MQRFTVGSLPLVTSSSIEATKWLALSLMLFEHVHTFVLGELPAVPYMLGRLVFPLFAIALAVGLTHLTRGQYAQLVGRLCIWGGIAAALGLLVRDVLPLNVLFTFAFGVTLHAVWSGIGRGRFMIVIAIGLAALTVEYSVPGVVAVALLCAWAKDQGTLRGYARLLAGLSLVCVVNGNWFALLAAPLAFAIEAGGLHLPRVRRVFYYGYALQWPVFSLLRALA